jgi:hypothetical protein
MAGFAFEIFISVLDIPRIFCHDFFMAFVAGYIGVLAFQPETGPAVVEIHRLPVFRRVAGSTVSDALFKELIVMGILVAIGAALRQSFELLMDLAVGTFPGMTGAACLSLMSPRQDIIGFVVVETNFAP